MPGLTTTFNVCPGCGASVGPRATSCALCETPLPRGGRRSAGQRTPQSPDGLSTIQQQVWRELALALSPSIRIVGYLAEGGMGSLFLGYDLALKREVAIKVLTPSLAEDLTARERFKREAEAAGGVSHPNVVAVYQVGELATSNIPYFVMQYVDGPTLQHAVQSQRVLSEAKVRRIVGDVAAGLAAAHRRGLVHRDIKPTNIVLDAETARALVLDFGIAAALDVRRNSGSMRLTTEGMYIGTPMYMSPEQAGTGELTDRTDIYSLGVVAFELLTGRPPFQGSNPMVLMASHIKEVPPRVDELRPDVSPELAMLIERCLAKAPLDRPSAQAIIDFLEPEAALSAAWPPPGLERGRGAGARLLAAMGALGGALLVFLALLYARPTLASPEWAGGERSAFWGSLFEPGMALAGSARSTGERPDAAPVWGFLLGVTTMLVIGLAARSASAGARVARIVARGRRAGYPWVVLADVLADRWIDTEALLAGRGRFVLLDGDTRRRFLHLRRWQSTLYAAAVALALITPVAWLFGALSSGAPGTALVTGTELIALALPPLVLVVVALACAVAEVRWRRRNAAPARSALRTPLPREELVRSWLQATHNDAPRPSRVPFRPIIQAGALVVGGLAIATVGLVLFAVLMTSWPLLESRPTAAALAARLSTDSLRPREWSAIDSTIALSTAYRPGSTADTAAIRLLVGHLARDSASAVWNADLAGASTIPNASGRPSGAAARVLAILPARTTPVDVELLRHDTATGWLQVWRRVGQAPPLPVMWARRSLDEWTGSPFSLPVLDPLRVRHLRDRNAAAAVLALSQGDASAAVARVRENIGVGRQLARSPSLLEELTGLTVLQHAAQLLGEIGRVVNDAALAREGAALEALAREARVQPDVFRATPAIFADPAAPIGRRLLGDAAMSPGLRVELPLQVAVSMCLNARELLFGVDPRRLQLLREAAQLSGIGDAAPMAAMYAAAAEAWLRDPGSARATASLDAAPRPRRRLPAWFNHTVGAMGLGGLRDRLDYCAMF